MEQVDVATALNALLATKPAVQINSTRTHDIQKCHGGGGKNNVDPWCEVFTVNDSVVISVPATTVSTRIAEVLGIKFGEVVSTGLPEKHADCQKGD